jgi:hypothetical protein
MNTALVILGSVILLFSLFTALISCWAIRRNKEISERIGATLDPETFDPKTFGRPRTGLVISIIGIVIGVILIISNI